MVPLWTSFLPVGRWDFPFQKRYWGLQDLVEPRLWLYPVWGLRLASKFPESSSCSHYRRKKSGQTGCGLVPPHPHPTPGAAEAPASSCGSMTSLAGLRLPRHDTQTPWADLRETALLPFLRADSLATSLLLILTGWHFCAHALQVCDCCFRCTLTQLP